ncbi:MAG: 30S ribosomal protein S20 [Sedimentisphaerales bacterium]|nr:30S ribosomal protein S20 [Sedimentisphaerales bacterium]
MAHSLSAKKRVRQNAKRRTINRTRKSRVKTQIKHFEEAVVSGDAASAAEKYKLVTQMLDKTASTSTMHKKTAARKKSRLAKKLNALKAKQA